MLIPHHSRRAGFTLIELVVAATIIAILAGAAVPVTTKVLTYRARNATKAELEMLSEACGAFFYDCERLPADLAELLVDPGTGDPGWTGPYLPGVVTDELSGLSGYQVDAWSRPYILTASGDVLTLTSQGEDATTGTATDIVLHYDVTWIRREKTRARLATVNQAIAHYNASFLVADPLPANWAVAFSKLTNPSLGILPNDADFSQDGWGDAFVEDPLGVAPVVRVTSSNMQ